MAWEERISDSTYSAVANADLSGKQYYAVSRVSGNKIDLSTAAKAIAGILQDKPISGQVGSYARSGVTKAAIAASQTLTAGVTLLEVASGGTLVVLASGIAVAKALESLDGTIAAVTLIAVELLPSNAAFT